MEVLLAILCLHEHGVIYRDSKPENILLSAEGHCALADFGLSKDFNKEAAEGPEQELRANSFVGSPFYVAPDVLKQKEYSQAVDFWSFGILLYRMLCGRCPFNGKNMKEVFDNILYSELRFPSSVTLAPEAKDLISRLLIKDAAKRIKGPEVKGHPFWADMSFDDVMKKKVRPPHWTPLPPPEEVIRMRQENPPAVPVSSKQPVEVVNTPAQSKQIAPIEQTKFEGFSCDAQGIPNVLKK
jgi:serine/threonine protein kinase